HGFWEEAVSLLREAIEEAKKEDEDVSDDQMGGARLKLAGLLKRAGQYTEAAEIYEEYAEEHGAESDARLSLVECWIKGGEPERVEEQIAEWLDVRSDDALSEALDLGIEVVRILRKEQEDLADQIARKLLEEAHEVDDEEVIEKLGEMGWEQEEVSEESETEDDVEGDEDSAEGDEGAEEEAESSETGEK
ncbi:MAG: tetratricopeptide repeat protein, partial [Planctomycetota bacterium]